MISIKIFDNNVKVLYNFTKDENGVTGIRYTGPKVTVYFDGGIRKVFSGFSYELDVKNEESPQDAY